jgi:hypothetical protein
MEVPADLTVDGRNLGRVTIRNASVSGALLETTLDLPLQSTVVLNISMPDAGNSATRTLDARVTRIDPTGIGIEWSDMAGVDVTDLLARASKNGTARKT